MKRYLELGKYLIKSFAKEKAGSAILEIVIILAIFGVSAAVITPIVRTQLAETYDSESKDITFGGERGDAVLTATPQTNSLTAVDTSPSTTHQTAKVFRFDGSTYLQLPKRLTTFGSTDFTLEGWFNIITAPGADAIFGLNGSQPVDNNLTFGVWGNKYHINPGPDGNSGLSSPMDVKKNQKVHLAWSVKSDKLSLYENGVLIWSVNAPRNYYTKEEGPKLGMEFDNWTPSDFYDGYMYEVRLYTKALTQTEVTNNMNGNTDRSSLVGEYLFNDGAGNVIIDHSGSGNDAVIVGNPVWENK
ncbi:LamG domain-containing protein [Priestia aryabhattai]|uniref:LamG domain-containing protein n=1 Tax=Priestia aryabhattai TaxID=412384 RepID=A0AAX6NC07_PRIAR|nr:LamG domain-containing protein [Priestia aryabhattai]MDU9693266.1 LamG domain-containing protein [Priestia aryabhattai]